MKPHVMFDIARFDAKGIHGTGFQFASLELASKQAERNNARNEDPLCFYRALPCDLIPAMDCPANPDQNAECPHCFDHGLQSPEGSEPCHQCQTVKTCDSPLDYPLACIPYDGGRLVGFKIKPGDKAYGQMGLSEPVQWLRRLLDQLPVKKTPKIGEYQTRPAESLAGIAMRELGDSNRWVEIRDLNEQAFPYMRPNDYYPVDTVLTMPADYRERKEDESQRSQA